MVLQVITTDLIGAGPQVTLAATDNAFIEAGVIVASTVTAAIDAAGFEHSVNVQGTVVANSHAVLLGTDLNTWGQHLIVGKSGYVGSAGNGTTAARLFGYGSRVDNDGTIHGEGAGLALLGANLGSSIVYNAGLIEGQGSQGFAVYRFDHVGNEQTIELHNTGEMRGYWSYYARGAATTAADIVYNAGLMVGGVALGADSDVYDGTGGRLAGAVYGDDGDDQLTGGDFAETLDGGAGNDSVGGADGNDYLNGGADADFMNGGAGNDTFFVGEVGDNVTDTGGGIDQVQSTVSFSLVNAAQAVGALENLTLTGNASINGTGNALANTITGNSGNNFIHGLAGNDSAFGNDGNDRLWGEAGNDTLSGGNGVDFLYGGLGNDRMTGGALADRFYFDTKPNASLNRDVVTDFQHGLDKIMLENALFTGIGAGGGLNAAFFFAGAAAHDANDRIVYNKATGVLSFDADGIGGQAAVAFAQLSTRPGLSAGDFGVF